jgi:hypothetical protein
MLPNTLDMPSCFQQTLVCVAVTPLIRSEFYRPPIAVSLGLCFVLRAGMPETAVDEDSYPRGHKHQVGAPTEAWQYRSIHEKPQSKRVQATPNRKLRRSVSCAYALHPSEGAWRRCARYTAGPAHDRPSKMAMPTFIIKRGGTAFPIALASTPRRVAAEKLNESGNVCRRAAS